jgi:glyoxylase-like metal-dependent hydrolase (beta-lactamase superfamily II)
MKEPYPERLPEDFNIEDYSVYQGKPTKILADGDTVDIGQRRVKVIHTPGHSPGHICLFEEERGYLFTGDLIYKGTLDTFYPSTNPLQFMHSVDKISKLSAITKVLPAHYSMDVRPEFIRCVKDGFLRLFEKGLLVQGSGIFDFGEYQIHL